MVLAYGLSPVTMHDAHAYCDEAGSTGANLVDQDQPLLLVGGWLVNDGFLPLAQEIVTQRIDPSGQSDDELHGVDLLRTEAGTQAIIDLVGHLLRLHCGPMCQIIEKRFLLAGTVYETFLDPDVNPLISDAFVSMWQGKHQLGEKIYALPDKLLHEFAEAFDSLDRTLLLSSLRNLTIALSLRMDFKLADLMLGSLDRIDLLIEKHKTGRTKFHSKRLNAPNVASFHMFFHSLEDIGRAAGIPRLTLVHDDNQEFRKLFRMIFEEYRDDQRKDSFRGGPWSTIFHGFESVKVLRFANSKNEPMLQAADVLVSALYRYTANLYKGVRNTPALAELASLFLKEPPDQPAPIRMITSDGFLDTIRQSFC